MAVYLLHLDPPYRHAKHYLGFTDDDDVTARLDRHHAGRGSPLIKAALAAGCSIVLAKVFPGATRTFERSLKKRRDTSRWCPCCGQNSRPVPIFSPAAPPA